MGLLDGLLGTSADDPRSNALLALAGGMVRGDVGGGLLGYGQEYQRAQAGAMQRQMQQMQMDNYRSEIAQRDMALQTQARRDAYYMGDGLAGGPAAAPAGLPSAGGQGGAPMAASGGGAPQAPAAAGGDRFSQLSAQYGIPREALVTDYLNNSGKGIAEMIYKRGTPNIEFINGVAVNKNEVGQGFSVPTTSANGQSSQTIPDPTAPGGFRIISPNGALETFAGYKGAEKKAENDNTPLPLGYVGRDGRPLGGTVGGYLQGQSAPQPAPAMPPTQPGLRNQGPGTLSPELQAAILRDAQANGITNPQANFTAPGFKNPVFGLDQQPGAQPQQAAPRPVLQSSAEKTFGDKMGTDQAEILSKGYGTANDAVTALQGIQESRKSMQAGAFQGSGADAKLALAKFGQAVGINIDPNKVANTDYLKSTLGNGLLEKAKTLGSNPSNADASRITDIVGSIGKDPLAMAKILDWQEEMARKGIDQHNTRVDQASANGFSSQFDMHVKAPEPQKAAGKPADRLKAPPSASDIANTALKYGMTVEQVKQKLGL